MRETVLRKWLEAQGEKSFHFFTSPATTAEFTKIFEKYPGSTFTNPADFSQSSKRTPLQYYLHEFFCFLNQTKPEPFKDTVPITTKQFFDRILDHCIELAENE